MRERGGAGAGTCASAGTWRAGAEAGGGSGARGGRAVRERVAVAAVRAAVRTSCVAQYCAYAQAATRS